MSEMLTTNEGHYVYIYRDPQGRARYVGYGERSARATAHLTSSHNPQLEKFVASSDFSIEVAGPYLSAEMGRTVETSLISALKPDLNVAEGPAFARFRPIGVPLEFADRPGLRSLQREELISIQGVEPGPVLMVIVGTKDFGDGRAGYDVASPPSDEQIRERTEKWWSLSGAVPIGSCIRKAAPWFCLACAELPAHSS